MILEKDPAKYRRCPHTVLYMCPHTTTYMCPHTAIYLSAYCYMCPHTTICIRILLCVRILLYMCPHTTIYVCPNTNIFVVPLYMCPHAAIHVSAAIVKKKKRTNLPRLSPICVLIPLDVSSYHYMCVISLDMCSLSH